MRRKSVPAGLLRRRRSVWRQHQDEAQEPRQPMTTDPPQRTGRPRWTVLLAALCAAAFLAGGWAWWSFRRYQSAMDDIQSEIVAGRYAFACKKIDGLLSWKADASGEINYLLGSCELRAGEARRPPRHGRGSRLALRFFSAPLKGGCVSCKRPASSRPPKHS